MAADKPSTDRLRTLFQTFDPARFDQRNSLALGLTLEEQQRLEREDMAMARAEVLGAVMFGHEIVVPAGSAADSPAFVQLLGEVMAPSSAARFRIAKLNGGRHYTPFRLGLEPRFSAKRAGGRTFQSEYDHFVWDYLNSSNVANIDRRVLDAPAAKSDRPRDETLMLIGHAFLERRTDDIAKFDQAYAEHVRWVEILFGNDGLQRVTPVYSPTNQFSDASSNLYAQAITICCDMVEEYYDGADEIRSVSSAIQRELAMKGRVAEANRRGLWYTNGQRFGEHWPVVRNWLDRRIGDMFVDGYDVALPSYLSQPVQMEGAALKAAFAYVNDLSPIDGTGAGGELLPQHPLSVDWAGVWDILAQEEVQRAQRELQKVLTSRRREEMEDRVVGRRGQELDRSKRLRLSDRALARRAIASDALARYVEILNAGQTKIRLSADGRRAVIASADRKSSPVLQKTGDVLGGAVIGTAGTPIAASLWPEIQSAIQLGMTGPAAELGSSFVSNVATGGIWLGMSVVAAVILGRVRRTPAVIAPKFADAEKARVSVWMTGAPDLLAERSPD